MWIRLGDAAQPAAREAQLLVGQQVLLARLRLGDQLVLAARAAVRLLAVEADVEPKGLAEDGLPRGLAALDAAALGWRQ